MVITSGDITLDKLLGGGFQKDLVYLLFGNINNTSDILLKTLVTSQKPILKEGLGEGFLVAFIDGNHCFNADEVIKYAISLQLSPETVLHNITISRAPNWDQMIELLENRLSKLEQVRVVLISGITTILQSYERQTFEDLLRAVDEIKNIFERTKPLIVITAPLNEDFLFSPIEDKDLSLSGKVIAMINDDEQYVEYTLVQNLLLKWKRDAEGRIIKKLIDPQKIYEDYTKKRLSEHKVVKTLIKIIEEGNISFHVEISKELLSKIIINNYDPFFLFTIYDLIGWSEDPLFKNIKKLLFKKIGTRVWELVGEGVVYEEAIILALFEGILPILINLNKNPDAGYNPGAYYKTDADGHVILFDICPTDEEHINFVPENIYRLRKLEELGMIKCCLDTIPESLGRLKSLRVLNLDYNLIVNLPESIGDLDSLEGLSLIGNYIESIPESIVSLKSLRELRLDENNIKNIPESVIPFLKKLGTWQFL